MQFGVRLRLSTIVFSCWQNSFCKGGDWQSVRKWWVLGRGDYSPQGSLNCSNGWCFQPSIQFISNSISVRPHQCISPQIQSVFTNIHCNWKILSLILGKERATAYETPNDRTFIISGGVQCALCITHNALCNERSMGIIVSSTGWYHRYLRWVW